MLVGSALGMMFLNWEEQVLTIRLAAGADTVSPCMYLLLHASLASPAQEEREWKISEGFPPLCLLLISHYGGKYRHRAGPGSFRDHCDSVVSVLTDAQDTRDTRTTFCLTD